MVPHWGFDLHFSDNEWCWASFHMIVSHLYLWRNVCLVLWPTFWLGHFFFLELSCRSCWYIFEISCLSVASFAIIFSHSKGCLLTLLIIFCFDDLSIGVSGVLKSPLLLCYIFSHSEGCLFTLLIVSFVVQKFLSFIRSHLFIFCCYFHYSGRWIIEDLVVIYVRECSAYALI